MNTIHEPARDVPIAATCDICVVGGGCTGVFAAVAAARSGARVCLIEKNGFFGGVATAGLVNIWHSILDERGERQIIGGLTTEVIERLGRRRAILVHNPGEDPHLHVGTRLSERPGRRSVFILNTEELKIELDELLTEAGVRPFLHARFVVAIREDNCVTAAIIEDKSGRRAIRAAYFIDATGDGDLIVAAGLPWTRGETLQPPTTCARIAGLRALREKNPGFNLKAAVFNPTHPKALQKGFLWTSAVPGVPSETFVAGTRVHDADCSDADQLTRAEIEGRRQVRCICDILREDFAGGEEIALAALPACIGIRETRKARCLHTLTADQLLRGVRFPDAIANGTYPVDIHYADRPGIVWRRLDGTETYYPDKGPPVEGRWREPLPEDPTFYQIPYRSLVPQGARNIIVCGRLIDTDRGAFGATRVMVNCNQTGEAAGTAAQLALTGNLRVAEVNPDELRRVLAQNGAIII